jgi:hypothetical protein
MHLYTHLNNVFLMTAMNVIAKKTKANDTESVLANWMPNVGVYLLL